MKKISFKNVSSVLSEKEMRNVMGGSGISWGMCTVRCAGSNSYTAVPYGNCHSIGEQICSSNAFICQGC